MGTPAKTVHIFAVHKGKSQSDPKIVVGRIISCPRSNAIHAEDVRLRMINAFIPQSFESGTILTAFVSPTFRAMGTVTVYGSVPHPQGNFASLSIRALGGTGGAHIQGAGTVTYEFVAFGE